MTIASKAKHLISFILLAFLVLPAQALGPAARAEPVEVRSAALDLDVATPAQRRLGRLDYLGGLILASEDGGFGSYSGMAVDADGGGLWAVSDTGHWLRLDFRLAADGLPADIAKAEIQPLRDARGAAISSKALSDAEGLRRLPDGRWLVSFERAHRLWFYDAPGGAATGTLSVPAGLAQQPANGGIEALAAFRNGDLLLLSEDMAVAATGAQPAGHAAWLWRDGAWRDAIWPARDDFKPTDAVALDNGDAIVLERYFSLLVGPKARLQRLRATTWQAGQLQPELLAEWARPLSVDNMEALDARRMPDGSLWLYVMSDDNQNPLQRTLLMVFRLAE